MSYFLSPSQRSFSQLSLPAPPLSRDMCFCESLPDPSSRMSFYQHSQLQLPQADLHTAHHRISSRRLHIAVSQIICQTDNILLLLIIRLRKQMTQIVGKSLVFQNSCRPAKTFHLRPHIPAIHRPSGPCDKDASAPDICPQTIIL